MLKIFTAAVLATSALTSLAHAGNSYVETADKYCEEIMYGALSADESLKNVGAAENVPFGTVAYEGELDGQPVKVVSGVQFGNMFCDVQFETATADDYAAVEAIYKDRFGTEGTVYDRPDGKYGYRGEIWGDSEAMNDGQVDDMKVGDAELSSTFVQFASEPFQQTNNRTGLLISMTGR